MKHPKAKQLVQVKSHTRKGKLVKSHKRLQEKVVDKEQTKQDTERQLSEIDNISQKNEDIEDLSWEVIDKNFRRLLGSDVDEFKEPRMWKDLLEDAKQNKANVMARHHPSELADLIIDEDFYRDIIDEVDRMQEILAKDFNNVKREDPFTIRIETDTIENNQLLDDFRYDLVDIVEKLFGGMRVLSMEQMERLKKAHEKYGPKAIKKHLYKAITLTESPSDKQLPNELLAKLNLETLKKNMWDEDIEAVVGDPEVIRKHFKTALKTHLGDPTVKKLYDAFSSADAKSLVIAATGLIKNKEIPDYKFNDNNMKLQNQYEQKLQAGFNKISTGTNRYVYFSKNPLAFITMSPADRFASCQSIRHRDYVSLGENNYNVLAAVNLSDSGDWIAFMANEKGEKEARVSLQWDGEKFYNHERGSIYGTGNWSSLLSSFYHNYDRISDHPPDINGSELLRKTGLYDDLASHWNDWKNSEERDIVRYLREMVGNEDDMDTIDYYLEKIKRVDSGGNWYDDIQQKIEEQKNGDIKYFDDMIHEVENEITELSSLNEVYQMLHDRDYHDMLSELEEEINQQLFSEQNPSFLYGYNETLSESYSDDFNELIDEINEEWEWMTGTKLVNY